MNFLQIIGIYGEGDRNIEEDSLLDMCNRNDWVPCKQLIARKESHKVKHFS